MLPRVLLCLLCGCAPDLREELRDDGPTEVQSGRVRLRREGLVRLAQVDARGEGAWVYLSLAQGGEVPEGDAAWDLGLQRFRIKLNGGSSGPGQGAMRPLPGVDFDSVTEAPPRADGYLQDAPGQEAGGDEPDLAFLRDDPWYIYDVTTHTLSPRDATYVVLGGDGAPYRLRIVGYYDDAGTAGYPTLRYAPIGGASARGRAADPDFATETRR